MRRIPWLVLVMLLATWSARPQAPVEVVTPANMAETIKALRAKAEAGDGSASVKLAEYPNHFTMLAYRARTGGAELHEDTADVFVIVDGNPTLRSGGRMADAKPAGPGEQRGTSVQGGTEQQLHAGDVVHIPAGVPHQMILAAGEHVAYFVVKVKEK